VNVKILIPSNSSKIPDSNSDFGIGDISLRKTPS